MWELLSWQGTSHRLKVPNGWIVRSIKENANHTSVDQIFVEDKNHEWRINKYGSE